MHRNGAYLQNRQSQRCHPLTASGFSKMESTKSNGLKVTQLRDHLISYDADDEEEEECEDEDEIQEEESEGEEEDEDSNDDE